MVERKNVRCFECREDVDVTFLKKETILKIKDKEYKFYLTSAKCKKCGAEISIDELVDINNKEIDQQYRKYESLVLMSEIQKLMNIYNVGKTPLSLALGFGEVTIPRYMLGQYPSKDYSNIILKSIREPKFLLEKLIENKEKIDNVAYNKMKIALDNIIFKTQFSDQLFDTISYILKSSSDITSLALQKLLYFVQGLYLSLYGAPLYEEDCEAWTHGPVYKKVYELFKDFAFNITDDDKYLIFEKHIGNLDNKAKNVIDIVLDTFGKYSGKVLENITHNEQPWKNTRKDIGDLERSNKIIDKSLIKAYFDELSDSYNFTNSADVNKYICNSLSK